MRVLVVRRREPRGTGSCGRGAFARVAAVSLAVAGSLLSGGSAHAALAGAHNPAELGQAVISHWTTAAGGTLTSAALSGDVGTVRLHAALGLLDDASDETGAVLTAPARTPTATDAPSSRAPEASSVGDGPVVVVGLLLLAGAGVAALLYRNQESSPDKPPYEP